MIKRHLQPTADRSFFLFGARGTGKSTFLRQHFSQQEVLWLDLLLPEEEDRYASRPQLLSEQIAARPDPALRGFATFSPANKGLWATFSPLTRA